MRTIVFRVGAVAVAVASLLAVGAPGSRAGTGPSTYCGDGSRPPGAVVEDTVRDPVTLGATAGSNPAHTVYIDLCLSNTGYGTPGSLGGWLSARLILTPNAFGGTRVAVEYQCVPDTGATWASCPTEQVGVWHVETSGSALGYASTTTVYGLGQSFTLGQTGVTIGWTSTGIPTISPTTSQTVGPTCVWVAGIPVPAGCPHAASASVAHDDLVPQATVTPGTSCLVYLGGCLVYAPSAANVTLLRDTANNTVVVTVAGITAPIPDPSPTRPACIGLGC